MFNIKKYIYIKMIENFTAAMGERLNVIILLLSRIYTGS